MTYHSPKYWKEMARLRKEHEARQQAIDETVPYNDIEEAQASSLKHQAPRRRSDKHQAPSTKVQAPSHKHQAS